MALQRLDQLAGGALAGGRLPWPRRGGQFGFTAAPQTRAVRLQGEAAARRAGEAMRKAPADWAAPVVEDVG